MKKIIPFLFSITILVSCSDTTFRSDYDKTVDFTKYKTLSYYGWAKDSDKILNEFDKERIEGAFATEFMKRGIDFKQSGGDITVSLFIVMDQKTGATAYTTHMGYGGWGYGPGWGWGMGATSTTYNEYDYQYSYLYILRIVRYYCISVTIFKYNHYCLHKFDITYFCMFSV